MFGPQKFGVKKPDVPQQNLGEIARNIHGRVSSTRVINQHLMLHGHGQTQPVLHRFFHQPYQTQGVEQALWTV